MPPAKPASLPSSRPHRKSSRCSRRIRSATSPSAPPLYAITASIFARRRRARRGRSIFGAWGSEHCIHSLLLNAHVPKRVGASLVLEHELFAARFHDDSRTGVFNELAVFDAPFALRGADVRRQHAPGAI